MCEYVYVCMRIDHERENEKRRWCPLLPRRLYRAAIMVKATRVRPSLSYQKAAVITNDIVEERQNDSEPRLHIARRTFERI